MVIVLCGKRGSGKSTIANFLKSKFSMNHVELSSEYKLLRTELDHDELRLREFVDIYSSKEDAVPLITTVLNSKLWNSDLKLISGIRKLDDLLRTREIMAPEPVVCLYIHVPIALRILRSLTRPERNSVTEFFIEEFYSIKWGDDRLRKKADMVVRNRNLATCLNQITNYIREHERTSIL